MNNEELIKENLLLREENEKLKKQLENYNNSRKSYYKKIQTINNLSVLHLFSFKTPIFI